MSDMFPPEFWELFEVDLLDPYEDGITDEEEKHAEELFNKKIWTTRDGDEIPIKKMSDNHLNNVLNLLPDGNIWKEPFKEELNRRTHSAVGALGKLVAQMRGE